MERPSFTVNEFEGPLDLILHLINKHQMDIFDIEISSLLEQYMAWIRGMESLDLDVASEFLEMASRLVYIKTVSMLPKQEEDEDPRSELVGELLEYQACKEAALFLGGRNQSWNVFPRAPTEIVRDPTYTGHCLPADLAAAYRDALGKGRRRLPPQADTFSPIVTVRTVSVVSRILHILRAIYRRRTMSLRDTLYESRSRSELVATFLAVLELLKGKRIKLADGDETIVLVARGKGAAGAAADGA